MAGVITEIAIECGVSEQAVRAWCRRNHVAKDAKGSFAISESQKTAIYQHYLGVERKQVSQPAKASCETCETTLIAMLQRIRPEKRATCCKGQADRGTERKAGRGQLGTGGSAADRTGCTGTSCGNNTAADYFQS